MRHRKFGRKLGRSTPHRAALRRNLARALFEHGRIVTTVAKAKECRPFAEGLITLAKEGTLHARRRAVAALGGDRATAKKLFDEIAPKFKSRNGGYTRILHGGRVNPTSISANLTNIHMNRLGDNAKMVLFSLVEDEAAAKKKPEPETAKKA